MSKSTKPPHKTPDEDVAWQKFGDGSFILKPRGLSITWGNIEENWHLPKDGPAELKGTYDLELYAKRDIDPKKSYEVGFSVSLSRRWNYNCPIFIMAKRGAKGNYIARKVNLEGRELNVSFNIPDKFVIRFLPSDSSEENITFGLFEIWNKKSFKSGLLVHHAFVKEVKEEIV